MMGRSTALLVAAAVVVGASATAQAADLLPPPPVEMPPPPPEFSGWYLRADVGVGATQVSGWRNTLAPVNLRGDAPPAVFPVFASLGDVAHFGAGFGYQYNNWIRGDLTGEYRTGARYSAAVGWANQFGQFGADVYSGFFNTALFMANGYVDLGTWHGISPFVGGGIGAAFNWMNGFIDHGFGYARDTSNTNFAWQVTGGIGYAITPNLRLEVAYRYLDLGTFHSNPISCIDFTACWGERHSFNVASHDVKLGFRYIIGGFEPAPMPLPPPGPLVRKY